jgi:hypothetical protein
VSPPTPDQEDAALAALTGTITEAKPAGELERNMLRLLLVKKARDRDIPWAVIGRPLGLSGKAAKAHMKRLAAQTQRSMLLEKAQQDSIGTPPRRGRARTPRRGAAPKPRAMPPGWVDEAARTAADAGKR